MLHNAFHNVITRVIGETSCAPATRGAGPETAENTGVLTAGGTQTGDMLPALSLLLVDDEPALLDLGKIFLERIPGITVTPAGSAAAALTLLAEREFDAVVSDYQMPEMDGIALLQKIRAKTRTLPFILFTGKGREDVVIEALNSGADHYVQKGGEARSQYTDLAHKVRRSVEQRRAEAALRRKHAVLRAILHASPYGIAYVRNRTFQWVNDALAGMLGYQRNELKGVHLETLYENNQTYDEIGRRIQQDLRNKGRSRIITRFRHRNGFAIDTEIHIAPLDSGNLHFGHMILMSDISRKIAAVQEMKNPAGIPHLEISPVIEVDQQGKIMYFNQAAIDAMVQYGTRGSLEEFFPPDLPAILACMDEKDTGSIFRDVRVGMAGFRLHITLSAQFRVARISAIRTDNR